jgi:hypothetical protein
LKRNRLEAGVMTATLKVELIDPSGKPIGGPVGNKSIDSVEELRAAFPPFKLRSGSPAARERVEGDRRYAVAMAAYDLGNYQQAMVGAATALALAPGDTERLELWEKSTAAVSASKRRGTIKPNAWGDRSYRLPAPLMPADCATDTAALSAFLKRCGMALPAGATAKVGDDGVTLMVHNLGREIGRLEAALEERVALSHHGAVSIDVEVVENAEMEGWFDAAEEKPFGEGVPGIFGIAAVLTDPQFRVIRAMVEKKAAIGTLPRRKIGHGKTIDVLKGSPLSKGDIVWSCDTKADVGRDGLTIDVNLTPEVFQTDDTGKAMFSTRRLSTSVTVWDGQWIVLSSPIEAGGNTLVFMRLRVAKL